MNHEKYNPDRLRTLPAKTRKMWPKADLQALALPLEPICIKFLPENSPSEARAIVSPLADYKAPSRNSRILARITILCDELQCDWSYNDVGSVFGANKDSAHRN
jgi:hypothetical protein